ncbi:MAG: phasin family protein [Longimicrobiaceae bacterium]
MPRKTDTDGGLRVRDVPQELLDRGRAMAGVGRDIWLAGLGVVAVAGEEGSHLFDRLVERGEELERRGKAEISEGREELSSALDRITGKVDALVARAAHGDGAAGPVKVYRVFRDEDGWSVVRGKGKAVGVHATKDLALDQARGLARGDQPSRLEVFRKDGTLQDTFAFTG